MSSRQKFVNEDNKFLCETIDGWSVKNYASEFFGHVMAFLSMYVWISRFKTMGSFPIKISKIAGKWPDDIALSPFSGGTSTNVERFHC